MSDQDAQAQAGTVEGQGPVEIDEELARHLGNKREELFEKFEIPDEFPPEVMDEAGARTEDVGAEIQAEIDDREDLRDLTTWTTDPVDAQDFDDALSVEERDVLSAGLGFVHHLGRELVGNLEFLEQLLAFVRQVPGHLRVDLDGPLPLGRPGRCLVRIAHTTGYGGPVISRVGLRRSQLENGGPAGQRRKRVW